MEVIILRVIKKGKKFEVVTNIDDELIVFTEDSIVNNKVFKDKTFTINDWEAIKTDNELSLIIEKALHYIDYKPRTKKEVVNFLINKDINNEVINKVIDYLIKIRYIDDEKYAKLYTEESIRKLQGPNLIKHKLYELGIDKLFIEKSLEMYSYNIQLDNATLFVNKFINDNSFVQKQKELIYNKLIRNGYDYEIISQVFRSIDSNK